ncbi:MAG: DUF882 domain-containing protein [Gammaproteobacteria bacterium]|nr:DUF882 domain-containing protein [Gammaproteobacteria bacterium]
MNDWCKYISLVPDHLTRRHFLKLGAFAGMASLAPFKSFAGVHPAALPERALGLYNTHTGEQIKTVYCANGEYIPSALAEINHILRDHRNEQVGAMDPQLLDLLHSISARLDSRQPFHVISGFRSKETNAMLAERSGGVAKHSLHMQGLAIDIRVPGCDLAVLRKTAVALQGGGVGYYPRSDFVHVDVGRVRYW